jgi:hypothetical protein
MEVLYLVARSQRGGSLVIAACKIEMDPADLGVARRRCRRRLFGRSPPIIDKISFHRRHPPMARPEPTLTRESLNRSYPHSIGPAFSGLT